MVQTRSTRRGFAALAASAVVAGCGPAAAPGQVEQAASLSAAQAGYAAPPELSLAAREDEAVVMRGRAAPGAEVRLQSPEGADIRALADARGVWSTTLADLTQPRMFAFFSVARDGRLVRGEGPLLALPRPGPAAVMLRAGFGAQAASEAGGPPRILALDYDEAGGAAVAGMAPADSPVQFSFDGAPAGVGQADAFGRFSVVAANRPLNPGPRRIVVETVDERLEADLRVSPPAPLQAPYRARREPGAWRIDWAPPGGGVQTTLVFDEDER